MSAYLHCPVACKASDEKMGIFMQFKSYTYSIGWSSNTLNTLVAISRCKAFQGTLCQIWRKRVYGSLPSEIAKLKNNTSTNNLLTICSLIFYIFWHAKTTTTRVIKWPGTQVTIADNWMLYTYYRSFGKKTKSSLGAGKVCFTWLLVSLHKLSVVSRGFQELDTKMKWTQNTNLLYRDIWCISLLWNKINKIK